MNKVKKVPLRKCVVTLEQHPKSEMFRIVRTPEGDVVVDNTGKARGRGAYVVKKKSAIVQAQKKKVLSKHLEVEIPNSLFDTLLSMLGDNIDK